MVGWLQDVFEVSENVARLIISGGLIVLLAAVRIGALIVVKRRIDDPTVWYRVRKITSYVVWIAGIVVLVAMWFEGGEFTTYLGLVSAGLAIALADPIKDLAGWLFIVLRRPFRIGDRIFLPGRENDDRQDNRREDDRDTTAEQDPDNLRDPAFVVL